MIVTLEEAREYLRIDEDDTSNDDVIQSSLETAQALCLDISRCEEADYAGLLKRLRWLLFGVRRSCF